MTESESAYVTLAHDDIPDQTITVPRPPTGLSPEYERAGWHETDTATPEAPTALEPSVAPAPEPSPEPTPDAGAPPAEPESTT